jgi:hypothetical protein
MIFFISILSAQKWGKHSTHQVGIRIKCVETYHSFRIGSGIMSAQEMSAVLVIMKGESAKHMAMFFSFSLYFFC